MSQSQTELAVVEPQAFPLDPTRKYLVVINGTMDVAEQLSKELHAFGVQCIILVSSEAIPLRLLVQQMREAEKRLEDL